MMAIAILVTFSLGVVLSGIEIWADWSQETKRIDQDSQQILETFRSSAAEVAYLLDKNLANQVIKGFLENAIVFRAEIRDDFGDVVAEASRAKKTGTFSGVSQAFFGEERQYETVLNKRDRNLAVGTARIWIDPVVAGNDFFDRSVAVIVLGLTRNLLLAALLSILFYIFLTKPILRLAGEARAMIASPGSAPALAVPPDHRDNEIGNLIGAVNDLLRHSISMDATVEHRTRELENTIDLLKQEMAKRESISAELENKNAELERFAYTVSHDLKTPLVTITGFLGLLERDIAANDRHRIDEDIDRINSAVSTMGKLLDDLLELSRIGRVSGDPVICDLSEIARQATALVGSEIEKSGTEVTIENMPEVRADATRLSEVYQNLIENAVKFMGEQKAPQVKIGSVEKNGMIRCYVRDNGIGIAEEYRDQVFGLFERLNVDVDGTGVGLTLVKRIIEDHGGEIWIESDGLGRGSSVLFTLPT